MRAAVVAAALACSASRTSVAAAQPALSPPGMTPPTADFDNPPPSGTQDAAPVAEPTAEPANAKSSTTATLLAIAGTIGPLLFVGKALDDNLEGAALLGAIGMVFLPSAGHWYAGKVATPGLGMRVGGGAAALLALSILIKSDGTESLETVFWLGAGTFVAGTIYDIATAGNAARDWNTEHASLRPTVVRTPIGGGTGVGLIARF
jgi:hypothetical protein